MTDLSGPFFYFGVRKALNFDKKDGDVIKYKY